MTDACADSEPQPPRWRPRLPPGLGRAFWLAALLVGGAELALHSEALMHRYRSVFAVGRALDKLQFVEHAQPRMLFVGNSRTDNAVDPRVVARRLGWPAHSVFNLGLPGANALIYDGLIARLAADCALGAAGIRTVLLGLDESALQDGDTLGYTAFFADPASLQAEHRYADWLGQKLRLWSYSGNLRELREPEKAARLLAATVADLDPIGGGAAQFDGYRAGFGAAQNQAQVQSQEHDARLPPSPTMLRALWRAVATLHAHGVTVMVYFPPLRDRVSAYLAPDADAAPYRALRAALQARGVVVLDRGMPQLPPDAYVNAGHLNDRGAQPYSRWLSDAIAAQPVATR